MIPVVSAQYTVLRPDGVNVSINRDLPRHEKVFFPRPTVTNTLVGVITWEIKQLGCRQWYLPSR